MYAALKYRGFTVIEAAVASAIIAGGLAAMLAAYNVYLRAGSALPDSVQAMYLAEEGIESTVLMRDRSWSGTLGGYSTDTPYYLSFGTSTQQWSLTDIPEEPIDGRFVRTVTLSSVGRDGEDHILAQGGTPDDATRLVRVDVSWLFRGATSTISLSRYVTNLWNN